MGNDQGSPDYDRAQAEGRRSPECLPWDVLYQGLGRRLKLRRPPSRAWLVQWLAQQAVESLLGKKAGPALLLLRITSLIGSKGYAWISSKTVQAMAGCTRNTLGTYRRTLTAPWSFEGSWFPPLFKIIVIDRGADRGIRWIPLEAGWRQFLPMVDEMTRAVIDDRHAARQAARHRVRHP